MRKLVAGSLLIVLGVMVMATVVFVAAAQFPLGTCYLGGIVPCEGIPIPGMPCDVCIPPEPMPPPSFSWRSDLGGPCVTDIQGCFGTAVTIMGFSTPISACNARWAVPSLAGVGVLLSAVGIVLIRRRDS